MREEAEEKATALRDKKLVEAASAHGGRLVPPHGEERLSGQKLTVENVGKLEREVGKSGGLRSRRPEVKRRTSSKGGNFSGGEEKREKSRSGERPRMEWMDSERTITGKEG
jgi:hypothetical protein